MKAEGSEGAGRSGCRTEAQLKYSMHPPSPGPRAVHSFQKPWCVVERYIHTRKYSLTNTHFSLTLLKEAKVWWNTWCPTQGLGLQWASPWNTAYPRGKGMCSTCRDSPTFHIPQNNPHLCWKLNFQVFLPMSNPEAHRWLSTAQLTR